MSSRPTSSVWRLIHSHIALFGTCKYWFKLLLCNFNFSLSIFVAIFLLTISSENSRKRINPKILPAHDVLPRIKWNNISKLCCVIHAPKAAYCSALCVSNLIPEIVKFKIQFHFGAAVAAKSHGNIWVVFIRDTQKHQQPTKLTVSNERTANGEKMMEKICV